MLKNGENKKNDLDLERNINAYFKSKIEGGSKEYKKNYFKKRKYEIAMDEQDQIDYNNLDIMQSLFKCPLSINDILFAEQLFDNYTLFIAYKSLTKKQKIVVYLRYVLRLSEPIIADQLGISQQAVSKRNQAALKNLLSNYSN